MSVYDAVAPLFDRHRALPAGAALCVRDAVLARLRTAPRVLDLGAGSGRIGLPFIAAGDDYTGVDLSSGMMQAFKLRAPHARLAQADGCALPFADRTFDGVVMVQIFGGLRTWRALLEETLRVLRPGGALLLGRTAMPDDGIDACMKRQLDLILHNHTAPAGKINTRALAEQNLEERAIAAEDCDAASWRTTRTPQFFIDRHSAGAQFSRLPIDIRASALRQLSDWAIHQFGSLEARFPETHRFTLRAFRFQKGSV